MPYDFDADPRIDPRLKPVLPYLSLGPDPRDFASREEILAIAQSPRALEATALTRELAEANDTEEIVTSAGLRVEHYEVTSQPDANTIRIQFIRPDDDAVVPCVYYIHGGGMATMSCTWGNYRAWGKIIAHHGVAVAMVDFRNSISPSSVPDVAPFPAGLNDCVSGVKWVHANAERLRVDPTRVVVAGESGGGNLTLATGLKLLRDGDIALVAGLYAMCPCVAGEAPQERFPSTIENNGIFLNLHSNYLIMSYGVEAFERRDPLAWPIFATPDDVRGLPPVVINVNECDPLRDEGIAFYRFLMANGVNARCRQMMGTMHATEVIPMLCPDITRDTARDLAGFAKG